MASDREGTKINLAVSHMGVLVFQVGGRTGKGRAGLSPVHNEWAWFVVVYLLVDFCCDE